VAAAGLAIATAGGSDISGYVSEAGVPGQWSSGLFRASVLGVAAALGLVAVAYREVAAAGAALAAGAVFAALSGAVTCSPGCPLPPHDRPTARDLVHAGASVAALALCALAMVLLARSVTDPVARRISLVGAAVAVPLLAAAGSAMLLIGRSTVTGVLERLALAACLGWLVTIAVRRAV
jgi:hypothetical protein